MTSLQSKSVLVCGGGVIGLCCAYYLSRAGFRVKVVERNSEGADSCVQGSAGYLSPSHVVPLSAPGMVMQGLKWMLNSRSPFYIQPRLDRDLIRWGWLFARSCTQAHTSRSAPVLRDLCLSGRQLFVELAEKTNNAFELQCEGLVNLCKTQQGLDYLANGLARLANQVGVEAQILNAKQTAALEPGTRLAIAGSVYFPIDAHLSPRKFIPAMLKLLRQMDVEFSWNTDIVGWNQTGRRITAARSTAGNLIADQYVIAGGSWSPDTLEGLDISLPMQPGKGYSLTLEQPRFHLRKSLMLTESRVAVTPMGTNLRFGGTMEISGHNKRIRAERIAQIVASARNYLPEFTDEDFQGITPWFGYRPVSPDGLPYIGRFRRHENLLTACGHAMLGLSMGPISGLLIAELLTGSRPSIDLTLLDPDRFG